MAIVILSSKELRKINSAIEKNLKETEVSLDLGLSTTKLKISKEGFYIKDNVIKTIKIREDDKSCYVISNDKFHRLEKLQFFSHETGKLYKLIPTSFRPILKISGTSMHKLPFLNRIEKDNLGGKVLDSGTGLGYSAIIASKSAEHVTSIEIDKKVIEMAELNPYSRDLFENKKIKLILGDIVHEIKKFKDREFDFIIFDAGTVKSSTEFFSLGNYKEAYRVLKKGGKLYHYLPKHHILRGRDFASEVTGRLEKAGFIEIERNAEDSYIVAKK